MSRSQQASRYGRLAEEKAAEKYGLELDHRPVDGVRVDARDQDGNPWEVKAAMANRSDGPGRFRLWQDQHDVLASNGGGYVFVRYYAVERGIRILGTRSVSASALTLTWGGAGSHPRASEQVKILARRVIP